MKAYEAERLIKRREVVGEKEKISVDSRIHKKRNPPHF